MKGRILVDVPEHGLVCGEFADLPGDLAKQLETDGRFDTQAPYPGDEPVANTELDQDKVIDQTQDESDVSDQVASKSIKSRKSS